jgi:hypothetical protein
LVRHLEVERLAGLDLPGHEIHAALCHSEELFRVGIRDVFRPAVVRWTIALVEPVPNFAALSFAGRTNA